MEICTSHYNEDLEWLKKSEFPVTVIHHEGGSEFPEFKETYVIPNKGYEASAYLTFIIRRYDSLPEYIAFIHGHETAEHQRIPCMLTAIRTANIQKYPFVNLNNSWVYRVIDDGILKSFHKYVKQKTVIMASMGAQFIVHKDRILLRPKEYYQHLFDITETKDDAMCIEHLWHIIFGEHPVSIPHDDLFIPNIRTTYQENWIVPEPEKLTLRINHPPRDEHDPNMIFIRKINSSDVEFNGITFTYDIADIFDIIYKNSIEVKRNT